MRSVLMIFVGASLIALIFDNGVSAQPAGVTITPAALTLELQKGQEQASTEFTVTNHYAGPVSLLFDIGPETAGGNTLNKSALHGLVFVSATELALQPGESRKQTVTFRDGDTMPPGSQALNLVVTQRTGAGAAVSLAADVRLPLTLIKLDGAVSAFRVDGLSTAAGRWTLPTSVIVDLRSTGNTVLIPRGSVTLSSPSGQTIAQGTLNSTSLALSPEGNLKLQTGLTQLASAVWPGRYRITVNYGLGGGQAAEQYSAAFWYVAWWHIAILLVLAAGGYFGVRIARQKFHNHKKNRDRPPPKRAILIGRDIT